MPGAGSVVTFSLPSFLAAAISPLIPPKAAAEVAAAALTDVPAEAGPPRPRAEAGPNAPPAMTAVAATTATTATTATGKTRARLLPWPVTLRCHRPRSFANIAPGVSYFKKLNAAGNFVPVEGTPATVRSGAIPILIWWDYLLASEVSPVVKGFKIVIPTDAHYAGYYYQAVSKYAAHPAAARLWEQYLYSIAGQNLWLAGKVRPIEMAAMLKAGTINKKAAAAALPRVPGNGRLRLPTVAQQVTAAKAVARLWPSGL